MRILVAPDSFKGSLSAAAAADAVASGLRRALPEAELDLCPMADGGEGTVDAFLSALGGRKQSVTVTGPLGEPVDSYFGLLAEGRTAVLEAAAACGLTQVPLHRRDPRVTTTRGLGELLRAALGSGARRVVLGLGGSATNDGGAGMLQALGARLLDSEGRDLPPGGAALARLARIDLTELAWDPGVELVAAADVTNPLCGPQGASAVFGPQKGAAPQAVDELDRALRRYAEVAAETLGRDRSGEPGAGAAGGLGFALRAFLGARLVPGVDLLMEAACFRERARAADLVVTGEGSLDAQTAFGKAVAGVASAAAEAGVPTVALCGSVSGSPDLLRRCGVAAALSIADGPRALEELMAEARPLVEAAAERLGCLLQVGMSLCGPRAGGPRASDPPAAPDPSDQRVPPPGSGRL